jgi:4-amino-4-deoxy-L-arabinose transferase-like glycosyltransferase
MRRAQVIGLLLLLLGGSLFRFAVIRQYSSTSPDGNQYYSLSQELIRARRFAFGPPPARLTHARMPGYPLFLAYVALRAPMSLSASVHRAAGANVVLDLLTGLLLILILRDLGFPRWNGYLAFILVMICPVMLLFASYSLSESLATCLGTLAFWLAIAADKRASLWSGAACGAAIGAAFLVRADMITELPALIVLLWRGAWPVRVRVKSALVMLVAAALAVAPWGIRNLLQFGRPHLAATEWPSQDGQPLPTGPMQWMRTWAAGRPGDGDLSGLMVFRVQFEPEQVVRPVMYDSAAERATLISLLHDYRLNGLTPAVDERFVELARDRARRHPWRVFVALPIVRAIHLYQPPPAGDYPIRLGFLGLPRYRSQIFGTANAILYLLALGGALALWRSRPRRQVLAAIGAAVGLRTLLHMWAVPTFVCQRYLVEVIPLFIILGVILIGWCVDQARGVAPAVAKTT